jgi:hypothetical protein
MSSRTVTADKGSTGAQATFGLQKDTNLVGQQFACELLSETHFAELLQSHVLQFTRNLMD